MSTSHKSFNRAGQPARRRSGPPGHVSRFLSRPALATMLDHARQIDLLNQAVQACLPKPLQDHCQLINRTGGELVFCADTPVWAARFRLLGPRLRENLEQVLGERVEKLQVRVSPPSIHPKPLSAGNDETLRAGTRPSAGSEAHREPPSLEVTLKRLLDRVGVKKTSVREP